MNIWRRSNKVKRQLGLLNSLARITKRPTTKNNIDITGIPTLACICGSKMFNITVMWDEGTRTVSWYDLRQECKVCGAVTTAPTDIDGCD